MLNLLLCDAVKMNSSGLSLSYDPDDIQWAMEGRFYQVPVGSTCHSRTHDHDIAKAQSTSEHLFVTTMAVSGRDECSN